MHDRVIGLCINCDPLRVALSQAISTFATLSFLHTLEEGLVHAVVGECEAQYLTGVDTLIQPVADAHGETAQGASQARGRLLGAPGV